MDKFLKINSVQGGPFTSSQNLVDFTLDQSLGVVDLKDSYINLNTKLNVVETSTAGGEGIYSAGLKWTPDTAGNHPIFVNSALVKNCNLRCDNRGQLENIRRRDQLSQTLSTYTRSAMEQLSDSYLNASQTINPVNRNRFTVFREINKTGSIKSRNLDIAPIQISLADLFGFCDAAPECDLSKTGSMRVHCELNLDKVSGVVRMINPATEWAAETLKNCGNVSVEGPANTIETSTDFDDLSLSPFWVGQALVLNAVHSGGSNITNKRVVVSRIVWDKEVLNGNGHLELSFTQNWGSLGTGETYSNITVVPYSNVTVSAEFNFAEVVIKRVGNPVGLDEIRFDTFSTEETTGNSLESFQNQYQLEGDSRNLLVVFPDDKTDLISNGTKINSFRLRLNNQDLTDRVIEDKSSLYFDRINMTIGNMGYKLKNLGEGYGTSNVTVWDNVYDDFNISTIQNPLFQTDREKYLQVNINSDTDGVKKMTIFKQLPRVLTL